MSAVVIVDSSVLLNILNVPGRNQHWEEVLDRLGERIEAGDHLFIPMAAIVEVGNHIPCGQWRTAPRCCRAFCEGGPQRTGWRGALEADQLSLEPGRAALAGGFSGRGHPVHGHGRPVDPAGVADLLHALSPQPCLGLDAGQRSRGTRSTFAFSCFTAQDMRSAGFGFAFRLRASQPPCTVCLRHARSKGKRQACGAMSWCTAFGPQDPCW